MKTYLPPLLLLVSALTILSLRLALADDTTMAGQTPATGSTNASTGKAPAAPQGERLERLKAALAELNLTDAQKDQIKQIRASVTDRRERRQQIMAVLTPDQKAKLKELFQEHRHEAQGGASTPASPGGT